MSEIRKCRAAEIFGDVEASALIAEYSEECAIALVGKPAPRLDTYEDLERTGLGQCFAAYEDGKLCGFAMVIVAVVPHYALSCATVESIFVSRTVRRPGVGLKLMDVIEDYATAAGCVAMFYAAPVDSRLGRLLFMSSDRYTNTNHVFCRRLA